MKNLRTRDLRPHEIHPALKLVLPASTLASQDPNGSADHFVSYLAEQNLEINWKLAIVDGERLLGACLGIVSPGRTAMILPSVCAPRSPLCSAVTRALMNLEHFARHEDLVILQSLIPEQGEGQAHALADAGYKYLADLRYLALVIRDQPSSVALSHKLVLEDYCAVDKDVFLRTLEKTYEGSVDCPALTGLRATEDILLSHLHTGIHDPKLWFLARVNGKPIGVLLLTHVPLRSAMEIVYVGVVPEARGNSYGRYLVNLAIEKASMANRNHLMLAVDQRNHYAMKIYESLGFIETDRRHAWIRSLVK